MARSHPFLFYLKRSYALTSASSAPMPRIASQFNTKATKGKQIVHDGVNEVFSANMKMYATKVR